MKKFLLALFIAIVTLGLLAGAFMAVPKLRTAAFRAIPELVHYGFYGKLRYFVQTRDFVSANRVLQSQMNLMERFTSQRNVLLPGLIQNAEYVAERIRREEAFQPLTPFLERLASKEPDILPARLWLARAQSLKNPKAAFENLKAAAKLAPAHAETYRIALDTARLHHDEEACQRWVERYRKAPQFGGPHPHEHEPMFRGTGARKMAVDALFADGRSQTSENYGLQLDALRSYDFTFTPGELKRLRLHIGVGPGFSIRIAGLDLYHQGVKRSLPGESLRIVGWRGFVPTRGEIVTVSPDGETVTLHAPAPGFGPADRVDLRATIRRVPLVSADFCGKGRAG